MAKSKQVGSAPTNRAVRTPRTAQAVNPKPAARPIGDGSASVRHLPARRPAITAANLAARAAEAEEFRNMRDGSPAKEQPANAPLMAALRAAAANPEAKAVPEPTATTRPAQPKVSAERLAELITEMKVPRPPLAEAEVYKRVRDETGLKPAALARLIAGDQQSARGGEMVKWWDRIIWRDLLLKLSPEIQQAVDGGEIGSLSEVGQLWRVPAARRGEMLARLKSGSLKSLAAICRAADELRAA